MECRKSLNRAGSNKIYVITFWLPGNAAGIMQRYQNPSASASLVEVFNLTTREVDFTALQMSDLVNLCALQT